MSYNQDKQIQDLMEMNKKLMDQLQAQQMQINQMQMNQMQMCMGMGMGMGAAPGMSPMPGMGVAPTPAPCNNPLNPGVIPEKVNTTGQTMTLTIPRYKWHQKFAKAITHYPRDGSETVTVPPGHGIPLAVYYGHGWKLMGYVYSQNDQTPTGHNYLSVAMSLIN